MTALGSFSAGDVLTAADLNDISTYTTFTTTATNISINAQDCMYTQINELVIAHYYVEFSSTASGNIALSLPVDMTGWSESSKAGVFPPGLASESGGGNYSLFPCRETSDTSLLRFFSQDFGASFGRVDANTPFVWGNGDTMRFSITYMAA